jgi:hypothetical protein
VGRTHAEYHAPMASGSNRSNRYLLKTRTRLHGVRDYTAKCTIGRSVIFETVYARLRTLTYCLVAACPTALNAPIDHPAKPTAIPEFTEEANKRNLCRDDSR